MKIKVTIDLELEIDGATPPSHEWVADKTMDAISSSIPSVLEDSEEHDCIIFVKEFEVSAKVYGEED